MLPNLRIASPCSADWDQMVGDDRTRFCGQCNLNVYNFSAMATSEIENLVNKHQGRLCARFYRRADGRVLTEDCPVGFRARVIRVSRVAGAALSAAMGLTLAGAQQTPIANSSLVQIETASEGIEVEVLDPSQAVIPNATVRLFDRAGRIQANERTNEIGRVQVAGLAPGQYNIEAYAQGFSTSKQTITLSKGARARIRVSLTLDIAVMGEVVVIENAGPTPTYAHVDGFVAPAKLPAVPAANPTSPRSGNRFIHFLSALGHKLRS